MATTNTEVGVDAAASPPFPPFQSEYFSTQLVWLVLTFVAFYLLMSRVALPRLSEILETRSGRIARDLEEANRLKDESDAAHAAYEQELAEAKNRAHGIAQEARDAAKADTDAKREAVEADLATRIADAETRIAGIRDKAMAEVSTIAEDTTQALVEQLVGAKVTKAEAAKAVAAARGA